MGLNVIVFKNKEHLSNRFEVNEFDTRTGEPILTVEQENVINEDQFYAASVRLGNISEIVALNNEISQATENKSLLVEKVLYSGSHSGDVIAASDIPKMLEEVRKLKKENIHKTQSCIDFLNLFEEICNKAIHHNNPIVFV